jgi:hypothetical protein
MALQPGNSLISRKLTLSVGFNILIALLAATQAIRLRRSRDFPQQPRVTYGSRQQFIWTRDLRKSDFLMSTPIISITALVGFSVTNFVTNPMIVSSKFMETNPASVRLR